ncbi:hypothetical protein ACN47E_003797 [Coniothyrium glycines]
MSAALTTTFTPPARCTQDPWQMTWDEAQNAHYGLLGGSGYSSCLPPSFTPDTSFYYSPGLYCPAGYSTACSSTQVIGSETATIATCCPSGFSCQGRTRSAYPWEYTLGCTSACSSSYSLTYTDASTLIPTTCNLGFGLNAYSVQLRYRSADLATRSPPASSSPASVTAAAAPAPTTSLSAATSAPSSPGPDDGLSTGAKAGIGVGSVLGVALVAAICSLAWVLRSKSRSGHRYTGPEQAELVERAPAPYDAPPEKPGGAYTATTYHHHAAPQEYAPIDGIAEAYSPPPLAVERHELPAHR